MPGKSKTPSTPLTLSVVVPAHEVEPWIRETLDCILAQDVPDMEVLVVDDHSTDRTAEIVTEVSQSDPRVTLLRADRRGGGSARNLGADRARGRYLVFADGDDIIPDGAYAALVASLDASGSDIAIGDYLKFRPMDTWRPTDRMPAFDHSRTGVRLREAPSLIFSRPCWNKAFRREWWAAEGIRFPDVPRSNDIVPMTQAYTRARAIDVIEDVVYLYRERPGGSSMTARADSTASMVSYLAQEKLCAELIGDLHDTPMDRAFSSLVYDRDGYHHIATYVSTWEEPREGDPAVARGIQELLAATARPASGIHPLKRLTVQLAGHGEMGAARTMTAIDDLDAARELPLSQWLHAVARLGALSLVHPGDDRFLAVPLTVALCAPVDPIEAPAWRALLGAARRLLGDRGLMLVPEARQRPERDATALRDRLRADGHVTDVAGGDRMLVVEGHSAVGPDEAAFVLYDGEFDGNPPVRTDDTTWERDGERWRWVARFPVAEVPLHRPLTPALEMRASGVCVAVRGEGELPDYTARDSFLYDRFGGVVVIRRRRHWSLRAARRALIIGRDRLERAVRGR